MFKNPFSWFWFWFLLPKWNSHQLNCYFYYLIMHNPLSPSLHNNHVHASILLMVWSIVWPTYLKDHFKKITNVKHKHKLICYFYYLFIKHIHTSTNLVITYYPTYLPRAWRVFFLIICMKNPTLRHLHHSNQHWLF